MINFIQGRHMIDFRYLVKKSLAVLKFMLLPVLLNTAAVKAEVTYIHTDYLGSVSAKSNASGQVIERFHYAPFGLPADSSELNNKQSYTGHVFDNESQLIYMQARYYDPVIGRFYSNDPVSSLEHLFGLQGIQGFNRYEYANNNPYKYTDPDGKVAYCVAGPIGAGICLAQAANAAYRAYRVYRAAQLMASMANSVEGTGEDTDDEESGWVYDPETDSMVPPSAVGGSPDPGNNGNKGNKNDKKKSSRQKSKKSEHTNNSRKSTKNAHEKGKSTDKRNRPGGEKGDKRRSQGNKGGPGGSRKRNDNQT